MTATMTEPKERTMAQDGRSNAVGDVSQLLSRGTPQRTKDVDLDGVGKYRVRELSALHIETIRHGLTAGAQRDAEGKLLTATVDMRGYMARAVACGLVNPDGSAAFGDPLNQYEALQSLAQRNLEKLFEAVDELSGLTKDAKDALGKDVAKTENSTAS